jgi:threonine dehydratase
MLGCRVLCKLECINPIRSFKGRGASVFLARRSPSSEPLVTASAGNFGQGLAYAARQCGQRLIVFAATTADPVKVARMREFGAEVRLAGTDFDAAKQEARAFAGQQDLPFVEDGREPPLAEGAGTIALELGRWLEPLDALFIPVGNGALIGGMGRWMHAQTPGCRVIGVCAAGAPAMAESWRSGQICTTVATATVADTIAVRDPVPEALAEMRTVVDDMVTVGDDQFRDAVRTLHRELGLVVEPAGAASLAALMNLRSQYRDGLVAILVSGGNLAPALIPGWLT